MLQQVLTALATGAFTASLGEREGDVAEKSCSKHAVFFLLRVERDGGSGQKKQRGQRYTAPSATFDSQE